MADRFWTNQDSSETIITELKNPNNTLESLLKEKIVKWYKNSPTEKYIVEFITSNNNPEKILHYALMDFLEIDDFKQIHNCCVNILTQNIDRNGLKLKLLQNDGFLQKIVAFKDSEYKSNTKICSNYAKIIDVFTKGNSKYSSEAKIISENFGFLIDLLMENINILAFRELLIKYIMSPANYQNINEEIFIKLLEICNKNNPNVPLFKSKEKLFLALQTLLDIFEDKPSLFNLLDNPRFGTLLLKIGIDNFTSHPIISSNAFSLFNKIAEKTKKKDFTAITDSFHFSVNSLNIASPNALKIFPKSISAFIPAFFEMKCSTFMNERIVSIIHGMPINDLKSFVSEFHINVLIMQFFSSYVNSKTNGHFLELGKLLADNKIICCNEHEIDWNLFLLQKLNIRRTKANKKSEIRISTEKKVVHFSDLMPIKDIDIYKSYRPS
ncbi:hypothetical protein TRFO_05833 [Tritrichomonas foetus]|uniref:Uncharacterized protein n=1 Tax=Tritrichomonas foetus TaxID=1144522 RepID=A0A1J4K3Z8_9EUKA|nr:hypothetical protein TRFO_05833 [Tritrichomonas foetus]|eukprot:OHT05690.1 hypothetical protein TRFO_05833 [Tritrichomonas foetus]